jgi:hypothetical protein
MGEPEAQRAHRLGGRIVLRGGELGADQLRPRGGGGERLLQPGGGQPARVLRDEIPEQRLAAAPLLGGRRPQQRAARLHLERDRDRRIARQIGERQQVVDRRADVSFRRAAHLDVRQAHAPPDVLGRQLDQAALVLGGLGRLVQLVGVERDDLLARPQLEHRRHVRRPGQRLLQQRGGVGPAAVGQQQVAERVRRGRVRLDAVERAPVERLGAGRIVRPPLADRAGRDQRVGGRRRIARALAGGLLGLGDEAVVQAARVARPRCQHQLQRAQVGPRPALAAHARRRQAGGGRAVASGPQRQLRMQQRHVDSVVVAPRLRDQLRRQGVGGGTPAHGLRKLEAIGRDERMRRVQPGGLLQRREGLARRVEVARLGPRALAPQRDGERRIHGGGAGGDLAQRAHRDVGRRLRRRQGLELGEHRRRRQRRIAALELGDQHRQRAARAVRLGSGVGRRSAL